MTDESDELNSPTPLSRGHDQMLVFGLRDGAMWHVKDVPSGRACNCICPACNVPLIAVNQVTQRAAHYRHEAHADCTVGYETALHLAGKEALLRLKQVELPVYSKRLNAQASDGKIFSDEVVGEASVLVRADKAWQEVWLDGFRPDVVFEVGGHQLIIEIKVTHAVDDAKLAMVKAKGVSAIEIDLSMIGPEILQDRSSFEAYLVSDPTIRAWLYSRKLARREAAVMAKLKEQVATYESEAQRRLAAERARARREKEASRRRGAARRQLLDEQAGVRQVLREQLAPYLTQLERSQDERAIASRELRLALLNPVPSLAAYRECGVPNLFDRVKGHWVFKATFEQWQAHILDLLFPAESERPRTLLLRVLEREVVAKFGVPGFVGTIIEAMTKAPSAQILTANELEALPSPRMVIFSYLQHLRSMGLLEMHKNVCAEDVRGVGFRAQGLTVEGAYQAHSQQQEKVFVRSSRKAMEAKPCNQKQLEYLRGRPVPPMEPRVAERVLAIRASEQWVHDCHSGRGMRCSNCYMVSPQETETCPFCRARSGGGLRVLIDSERLIIARHILSTSPGLAGSLNSVPVLDLSGLVPFMCKLTAE